jgi:exodeoxyribonuclease V alpha subunit
MPDTLRGTIERITFHNEENGYTVAQLAPENLGNTVTVIGNMLGINIGESVELAGAWMAHPQYGRQFKADTVRTILPATIAGIEKYLGSGLIKGVGPVTAKRIVRKFGVNTIQVIEEDPQRLHEVLGVGRKRVDLIARAWVEQRKIKEVMVFLQSHGVSTGLAVKIYKAYGDDAVEIVRNDPYRLARDIYGIGFITADKIAREVGIAHDAPERVAAGVAYVLSEAADEGHVYLPSGELVKRAGEMLGVEPALVQQGIAALADDEQVRVEPASGPTASGASRPPSGTAAAAGNATPAIAEERPVYLVPFYYGEVGVANRLRRLAETTEDRLAAFQRFDWPAAFALLQSQSRVALTPSQMAAIQSALTHRVTVLTGGPGTGKTTTVRGIIRLAEAAGVKAALASPTGRAAKRLSEATDRPAKTIHRLLEVKPSEGFGFARNDENPLDADLVIVDETSMLDLILTNNLLKAIPAGAHLLLVGDVDQLPSVGAGNVLRDIIEAIEGIEERRSGGAEERGSGGIASAPQPLSSSAVVRLDTIFRQPEGSYIITNAHRINQGQLPVLDNRNALDFFLFREEDPAKAADLVVELVQERIPRKFGLEADAIQVLSPMHRGEVGVGALNVRLQAALNPPDPQRTERQVGGRSFRVGDRVMQIRNNYDKEVFNGDMGRITGIDVEEQAVSVRMDERTIAYDFLELDELVHAYAISIHKAQGSEFPVVVIPLLTTHYMMLQRNLLYTAVTRAQKLVVMVGSPRAIGIAVKANRANERYSGLAERLR